MFFCETACYKMHGLKRKNVAEKDLIKDCHKGKLRSFGRKSALNQTYYSMSKKTLFACFRVDS